MADSIPNAFTAGNVIRNPRRATIIKAMASRAKKKYQYRSAQQHTSLRAGQEGSYDIQIALNTLDAPTDQFYCNTATLKRRPAGAQFVFAQLHPLAAAVSKGLVLEMPYRSMAPLASTFAAPGFKEMLAQVTGAMAPMQPFPLMATRIPETVLLGAHIARILINDFAGVVDFYEVQPRLGSSQPINPVIRIKSLPSLTRWFVDSVDALAIELGDGKLLESAERTDHE